MQPSHDPSHIRPQPRLRPDSYRACHFAGPTFCHFLPLPDNRFIITMDYQIFPPEEMIDGRVTLPLSKSVANRLAVIDAIAGIRPGEADPQLCGADILDMRRIVTTQFPPAEGATIDAGEGATTARFVTALLAATEGVSATVEGRGAMTARPMGPLVDALRTLGAEIDYTGAEGCLPVAIKGHRLKGGSIELDPTVSSQFVSALMLVAPTMAEGLTVTLPVPVKERPYIGLTADLMARRGASVDVDGYTVSVAPGSYNDEAPVTERDWSAMAFWAELCSVSGGFITSSGLDRDSAQPDARTLALFGQLGVSATFAGDDPDSDDDDEEDWGSDAELAEGDIQLCASPEVSPRLVYDFAECPDLVPAAVMACCLIGVPFRFTGLGSLRYKESDRIAALAEELARTGTVVDLGPGDEMSWEGRRIPVATGTPVFDSHADHRIAMALAPAAIYIPGIVIRGAECVAKSYPGFWDELRGLGFNVVEAEAGEAEQ